MSQKDEMPSIGGARRGAMGLAAGGLLLVGIAGATGAYLRHRDAQAETASAEQARAEGAIPAAAIAPDGKDGVAPSAAAPADPSAAAPNLPHAPGREPPNADEIAAAGTVAGAPVAAVAPTPGTPAAGLPARREGLIPLHITVDGPLERSIVSAVGKELGLPLTQVAVRSLVWWIDVPGDLRKGDALELLVEPRDGAEPVIQAVRFKSGKTGQTHRAYRFKPASASFARYYQASGDELELRLKDAPLDEYEQITSLLRDGRGHQGVDFRTPIGTRVKAPFDGTIVRKNWNLRANGNSIELVESGGAHRTALFLHLSTLPDSVQPGRHVGKGEVLADSGNTGHSFAPHLHYQLRSPSAPVLDPFKAHPTYRTSLPGEQKAPFDVEVKRLDALLARSAGNGAG